MFKSKLFFVAALLLGGCLTINATNCYYQAEVYAVGHGKIYADGSDCMPDSIFLKGEEAYKTQMSALYCKMLIEEDPQASLDICTLPDSPEYEPVGVKFDNLETELYAVVVDTCSYTTEEEVTYLTQRIITPTCTFAKDTAHGVVYVIFKVKPVLVQAACDSIDNYVASKTEIISEELNLIINEGKENIRKNDDELGNMNAALDATIKKIDEYFSTGLSKIRSKKANSAKRIVDGRFIIEANGRCYNAVGQEMR